MTKNKMSTARLAASLNMPEVELLEKLREDQPERDAAQYALGLRRCEKENPGYTREQLAKILGVRVEDFDAGFV